jgi:L-alanine-DL-glutamate epimerase-like enolase superfamily enzyme
MDELRITQIEWARLEGTRPRKAGCNARLGEHGSVVRVPLARITTEDGQSGFGRCLATREQAQALLGARIGDLFSLQGGATTQGLPFDYPLWDWAGQQTKEPVYRLTATLVGKPAPDQLTAPCYDTSLYFDDLHLEDEAAAAALIASEAHYGYNRGHRAFKIKVGRGARHLGLEEGTSRDIAIIRAVRNEVGPQCPIMIDANNGYNLNLAKQVLAETADCNIFWLEEAFHEDNVLYDDLRGWLKRQGLTTLIADGEGYASPRLLEWAQAELIQVIQYDIFSYSFTPWLQLGQQLDGWGVRTAPHHYGGFYGNFASCHLVSAIEHFAFTEWDEASVPAVQTDAYAIRNGQVIVPDAPGFGLTLDEELFQQALATDGYRIKS